MFSALSVQLLAKEKNMDNNLEDDEKSFIGPLVVIGLVAVAVLVISGLFMHTGGRWAF